MKKANVFLCALVFGYVAASAQGLVGTKTIGGSNPDFLTLRAAVDTLSVRGVGAGGVTFIIRTGIYKRRR